MSVHGSIQETAALESPSYVDGFVCLKKGQLGQGRYSPSAMTASLPVDGVGAADSGQSLGETEMLVCLV